MKVYKEGYLNCFTTDLCGTGLVDDYIKCNEEICRDPQHELRPFCRKTCKLCEEEAEPGGNKAFFAGEGSYNF